MPVLDCCAYLRPWSLRTGARVHSCIGNGGSSERDRTLGEFRRQPGDAAERAIAGAVGRQLGVDVLGRVSRWHRAKRSTSSWRPEDRRAGECVDTDFFVPEAKIASLPSTRIRRTGRTIGNVAPAGQVPVTAAVAWVDRRRLPALLSDAASTRELDGGRLHGAGHVAKG